MIGILQYEAAIWKETFVNFRNTKSVEEVTVNNFEKISKAG
jgi:hypothetical protein